MNIYAFLVALLGTLVMGGGAGYAIAQDRWREYETMYCNNIADLTDRLAEHECTKVPVASRDIEPWD